MLCAIARGSFRAVSLLRAARIDLGFSARRASILRSAARALSHTRPRPSQSGRARLRSAQATELPHHPENSLRQTRPRHDHAIEPFLSHILCGAALITCFQSHDPARVESGLMARSERAAEDNRPQKPEVCAIRWQWGGGRRRDPQRLQHSLAAIRSGRDQRHAEPAQALLAGPMHGAGDLTVGRLAPTI